MFLLTLLAGSQIRHLGLEPSIDFLSPHDPIAQAAERQKQLFGDPNRLIVGLYSSRGDGSVLRSESLLTLQDLHRELVLEPDIARVSSLANAPVLVAVADGPPPGAPLLAGTTAADAESLRRLLRAAPFQKALLLSPRESLTPLFVELAPGVEEAELVSRILALARRVEQRHAEGGEVLVAGPAVVETALARHVLTDLSRLVPLTALLIALGLGLYLRRLVYLLIIVIHIVALEVWVLGAMVTLGWNIDLVSVLAPVIALPVGVADLLHLCVLLKSHREGGKAGEGRAAKKLLAQAFARLQSPMLLTTATTALGFLGFMLSPVDAIRQFGAILSLGAVVALLLTFSLDAALLALLWRPDRRPWRAPRKANRANGYSRSDRSPAKHLSLLERCLVGLQRSPSTHRMYSRLAVAVFLAALAIGALSLPRLHIDDTWLQNFDPNSRIRHDTSRFESELIGTNVLSVVFEADAQVAESRRRTLDVVNRFSTQYLSTPHTRGVLSATLLARSLDPRQGGYWQPWSTPTQAEMGDAYDAWRQRGLTLPAIESYVNVDLSRFRVQIFVLQLPFGELEEQVARVTGDAQSLAGRGVKATVTGDLATNVHMVRQAVLGQGRSLLVLAVTVILLLAAATRSLGMGLLLSLPMALAILVSYGLLVAAQLPYGIAVSMFPTLVVGLSVDFAIHLRASWRGAATSAPVSTTRRSRRVATTLRSILLNGTLWTLGFGLLAASNLPPNRYLGILCAAVIAASTTFTLLLVPLLARK